MKEESNSFSNSMESQ